MIALISAFPPAVSAQAEADKAMYPEWGWYETGFFLGAFAGYSGACACTMYIALPILMDVFWYSPAPTTFAELGSRFSQSMEAHSAENASILVWDVVCISGAIICNVVLSLRLKKAKGPPEDLGKTSVSVMGIKVGQI